MEEEFETYIKSLFGGSEQIPRVQYVELKRAFFAGGVVAVGMVSNGDAEKFMAEINNFGTRDVQIALSAWAGQNEDCED